MRFVLRLLIAVIIGIVMFAVCAFIPLFVISAVQEDPGNVGGGILTILVGFPIGLIGGIASGAFAFKKLR